MTFELVAYFHKSDMKQTPVCVLCDWLISNSTTKDDVERWMSKDSRYAHSTERGYNIECEKRIKWSYLGEEELLNTDDFEQKHMHHRRRSPSGVISGLILVSSLKVNLLKLFLSKYFNAWKYSQL